MDDLILIPSIKTYYEGTLLKPSSESFVISESYILSDYMDDVPNGYIRIDENGTYTFYAQIIDPRAGHYWAEISITFGGGGDADAVSENNRKTVEFDVRHKTPPEWDLKLINVAIIDVGSTFAIGYTVLNNGTKSYGRPHNIMVKI